MTGEYTFVTRERQNELTRRIQEKLAEASSKQEGKSEPPTQPAPATPDIPPNLAETKPVTTVLQ